MAGGTVFFVHVSGRRQFNLKGGCATLFIFFVAWRNQSFVFACLISNQIQTNQTKPTVDVRHSHVKHCSLVEHGFLFSRNTGEREALLMKHCSDVKHSSVDVNLCMTVLFSFLHVCGHIWTGLDYSFLMFCNVLDKKARQSNCNDLHVTKDVRYMSQLTRPT